VARPVGPPLPGHRTLAPWLGQLATARWHRCGRRPRISLPRSRGRARARRCGAGRRLLWRLGRGRDHGAFNRAFLASGAGRPARCQIWRPRRARHHRHARAVPRRISKTRLGRSGQRRGRFQHASRQRARRHRTRPRGFRPLWLEALHAQPAAQALAAPDRPADLAAVGCRRPDRHPGLRRELAPGHPERASS